MSHYPRMDVTGPPGIFEWGAIRNGIERVSFVLIAQLRLLVGILGIATALSTMTLDAGAHTINGSSVRTSRLSYILNPKRLAVRSFENANTAELIEGPKSDGMCCPHSTYIDCG